MEDKIVGTKWFKCDFHLHTDASKCFEDENYTPENFIQKAVDEGLQCIAITDHNTGKNIDSIKKAAKGKEITIFPGVEVTCTDAKIHILFIFDIDKTTQDIEDFLLQKLNLNREKFGESDAHVDKTVKDILKTIKESEAIAIPAHIDEYSGLSLVANEVKKEMFGNELVSAVQIVHKELLDNDFTKDDKDKLLRILKDYYQDNAIDEEKIKEWSKCSPYIKKIANLTFSDNPNKEHSSKHGLWGIGKQYSWIKMKNNPNLASLRQAFFVPALRVKNIFNSEECPYERPSTWIKKLIFKNTEITKPAEVFAIEFNPQLNTIIGGRGSGKSSIVRFIRGILSKYKDLSEIEMIKKEFDDFYKRFDKKTKDGILNENTEISIEIINNDIPYRITSSNINSIDNQSIKIERYDFDQNEYKQIESEEYISLFNVNIFSQKQIYEIASYPNALLNKIDETITDLDSKKKLKKQIHAEYLAISSEIRSLQEKVEGKKRLENEVDEIDSQIKALKESGITDLLSKSQIFSIEKEEIDRYISYLEGKLSEFEALILSIKENDFNEVVLKSEEKEMIKQIIIEANTKFTAISDSIRENKETYQTILEELKKKVQGSRWNKIREENINSIEEKKGELGDKAVKNIEMFQKLLTDKEEKQRKIIYLSKLEKEIKEKKDDLKEKHIAILSVTKNISGCRKNFIQDVLKSKNIKIKIKPYRNKEIYETEFRKIIQKDHEYPESIQNLIIKCFSGKLPDNLEEIHEDLYKLRHEQIPSGYDGYFKNCIVGLSPEQFDKLLLLIPEDEIYVEYKTPGLDTFKTISTASAGQKTATILTFILSFGNSPLILDQPEDDLDNHLVYGLIVDRLGEIKDTRQVIVVTHNANIPVNGDAEYIVAMDSESPKLKILQQGTIDEDNIKKEICDVMEGGEDAFKLRSKRYEITYK